MNNNLQDTNQISGFSSLYSDICSIIEDAREQAYRAVNVSLTLRYWMLGERIAREKLDGKERAEYGKQVIATLAKELTHAYGKGSILAAYINTYFSTSYFQTFWTQCAQNRNC